jgi:hypothetical protein
LRDISSEDEYNDAIREAAQSGMSLFAELSCSDNAAAGRVAKKRYAFLDSVKYIEEARKERRKRKS